MTTGLRLPAKPTELELGIFMAAYDSVQQRRRRVLAMVLLGVKHILRGLLFSWPVYVLGLAAFYSAQVYVLVSMLLLVPAVLLSGVILMRGVRDDYRDRVKGVLLTQDLRADYCSQRLCKVFEKGNEK